MTVLRALIGRRRVHEAQDPFDHEEHARQERIAADMLYGGPRTIDVAPIEAPASSYNSRRAAHQKSNGGRP